MSARRQEINLQFTQIVDAILLGAVFWFAHTLRYHRLVILDDLWGIDSFDKFVWLLTVIVPFGPYLLEKQGFYSFTLEKTMGKSLQQMTGAALQMFLFIGAAVIFLKLDVPSRSVLILFAMLAPFALLLRERVMLAYELNKVKQGAMGERVILAGEKESMEAFLSSFTELQRLEIQIVEQIDLTIYDVDSLIEAMHVHSVGRVVLVFSRMELETLERSIKACEVEGVEAWLNIGFFHTSHARPSFEVMSRHPMLVFRMTPGVSWAMVVKNVLDRVISFGLLIVLMPLLLAVALAVKLTSPGPVFFLQRRAGLHGRPFQIWKFRTMCVDAEAKRIGLASQNLMSGPVYKVEGDPRITSIGRWLRRTSIDELPQLINVLRGEMSIVGPRPLPIYEVEKFELLAHRRRLSMKPGLTCIWQVRGRNIVTNFDDWVRMDLDYIDNWSIGLDFYLFCMTVLVVLTGRGAK